MNVFEWIFSGISVHPMLSVLGGTFLFGDEMVYFFAFLSGHGVLALWIVILFSILGNGGCDIFWFSVARSRFSDKAKKIFVIGRETDPEKLSRIDFSKKRMFVTLCLSKFFYGTRLLAIFYVAGKEKKFKNIIVYNTLAVTIWVTIVSAFMWLIGKWTSLSFELVNQAHKIIGLATLVVLVTYIILRILVPRIVKVLRQRREGFK